MRFKVRRHINDELLARFRCQIRQQSHLVSRPQCRDILEQVNLVLILSVGKRASRHLVFCLAIVHGFDGGLTVTPQF